MLDSLDRPLYRPLGGPLDRNAYWNDRWIDLRTDLTDCYRPLDRPFLDILDKPLMERQLDRPLEILYTRMDRPPGRPLDKLLQKPPDRPLHEYNAGKTA